MITPSVLFCPFDVGLYSILEHTFKDVLNVFLSLFSTFFWASFSFLATAAYISNDMFVYLTINGTYNIMVDDDVFNNKCNMSSNYMPEPLLPPPLFPFSFFQLLQLLSFAVKT